MSDWYSDHDPFEKVGYVRIMLMRTAFEYGFNGKKTNCTTIVDVNPFQIGFIANSAPKTEAANYRWLKDCMEDIRHKINHLFINKPIGAYELVGDIYHWSSSNYDGEWDGDTEIRNVKIQEISFHTLTNFDYDGVLAEDREELDRLSMKWNYGYYVHYFMPKLDILRTHASVLTAIVNNSYSKIQDFAAMKDEEGLENLIHILTMQIDSEPKYEKDRELVMSIDKKVADTLVRHNRLMEE